MIDTQDVTQTSSPAQDAPADSSAAPPAEPAKYRSLAELTPKQREHYMAMGDHPDDKQTQSEDSSTSSETDTPSKPAPPSQAEPQERKARNSLDNRVQELLEKHKAETASLRAEIDRLTKSGKADVSADPSTAKQPTKSEAKNEDPKPDTRVGPDGQPWKNWNEYQEALLAWNRREAVREAQGAFQQQERDKQAAELNKKIEESWNTRRTEAVKKLGITVEEFDKAVSNKDLPIAKPTDGFILDSQHGAELAYYLGTNPKVAADLAKLDPISQIKTLTLLELHLSGQIPQTSAPRPKTTRTPPPATDLGARQTPPKDEAEAAAARGDFATYKRIMNERDLAAAKGR